MSAGYGLRAPQANWWSRIWQPFWTLPAAIALGSLVLGAALAALDEALDNPVPWVFAGGTEGARAVLGTISGAMISVTGLVFSITIVVLQLAASQFTPRVLGTFLQHRVTQVTLGVFTGCFLYALSVLRSVRDGSGPVPETAVAVSYLFVLAAVAMFLAFIHHVTTLIQVPRVMSGVRARTLDTLDRVAPQDGPTTTWSPTAGTPSAEITLPDRCGYLTVIHGGRLLEVARREDVVLQMTVSPGEFLVAGQPVLRVWGTAHPSEGLQKAATTALELGGERQQHHDLDFGFRQLLDIAERALSPGVNDPTTALQAMDQIHALLREMAVRRDPTPYLHDGEGEVRALYPPHGYADLLRRSVDDLVHYGSDSVRVLPHLASLLSDLESAARPEHLDVTRRARVEVEGRVASTALRSADRED